MPSGAVTVETGLSVVDAVYQKVRLQAVAGAGLNFTIKIPLTLAIAAALIVASGGERFAIPQLSVVELVCVRAGAEHRVEKIKDTAVLRLRDKLLPLAHLGRPLGTPDQALQSVSPYPLEMLRQMAERARQWVKQVVVHGMDSPAE